MPTVDITDRARVKRGQLFTHVNFLDPDWDPPAGSGLGYVDAPPAVCRITAVQRDKVYYAIGRESTKGRNVCTIAFFLEHVVRTWVLDN